MSRYIPEEEFSKITGLFLKGVCYADIAVIYGVHKQSIHKIVKEAGISDGDRTKEDISRCRRDKNYVKQCAAELQIVFNMEDSFYVRYGMSRNEFDELTRDYKLYKRYSTHRSNAKRRGVEFNLTFMEWLKIWKDSGQIDNSGKFRGRYVMARFYDRGAYEVGNVRIITGSDNHKETAFHRAILTITEYTDKSHDEVIKAIYG